MSTTINAEVRLLADTFKDGITLGEKGVATAAADLYEKTLPEGMTKEGYLKFQAHHVNVAAATMLALGEISTEAMKLDKTLDRTSVTIPTFGKDSFNATFQRSKEVVVPNQDGPAGTKTVYGSAQVSYDQHGLGKRGQVAAVRNFLAENTKSALGY